MIPLDLEKPKLSDKNAFSKYQHHLAMTKHIPYCFKNTYLSKKKKKHKTIKMHK